MNVCCWPSRVLQLKLKMVKIAYSTINDFDLLNSELTSLFIATYFTGVLFKWKGKVTKFINGELNFQSSPYNGFTISDGSHTLPCIVQNPLKNVNKLLQLRNNAVLLKEPVFLVET